MPDVILASVISRVRLLMNECVGGGGRYIAKNVDGVDVVGRIVGVLCDVQ